MQAKACAPRASIAPSVGTLPMSTPLFTEAATESHLAKPNYQYEKRQKELEKKRKKEEKLKRKQDQPDEPEDPQDDETAGGEQATGTVPPVQ